MYISAFLSDQDHFSGQEIQEDCDFYDEDYEDCITMQNKCKTVDGTSCIFPFMFRGKEITNCISTPPRRTRLWCPTQLDSSTRIPIRGQWGYCDEQCPMEGSDIGNFSKIKILLLFATN